MTVIPIEKKVLSENQRIAASLRSRFEEQEILCLNFISSPGSGKTTLLEQTLGGFRPEERVAVLTGDLQTENDAKRLAVYGFPRATDHDGRRVPSRWQDDRTRPWPLVSR